MISANHSNPNGARRHGLSVAFWCLLSLIALELFIRFFVINSFPQTADSVWGIAPVSGSCAFHGLEGAGTTCYGPHNEVDTPFHDGTPVVVLGDSYTEAIQVDNSEKYVSLVESDLRNRGLAVDLINLGDSNRTIADFTYLAPAINHNYAPEVVIVQTNEFGLFDSLNPERTNHFETQSDGSLKLIHRNPPEDNLFVQNFLHSSGLLTLSAIRWEKLTRVEDVEVSLRASPEQLTVELSQLIAAYPNSHIVVLIIPSVPIISTANTNLRWENPQDKEILSVLTRMENLTVVYPAPSFRELYKKHKIFPRGFFNSLPNYGHLNQYGHIAVATTLADALDALLR